MKPLAAFPAAARAGIRCLLCDIDDTLTLRGRLPATAYAALEAAQAAGLIVVPVTGRPAGWCDLIARIWPVDGVVGENGAFFYRYDPAGRRMIRRYWKSDAERAADRVKLEALAKTIPAAVPGAGVAADQPFRVADLAIDFAEDTGPLDDAAIAAIVAAFEAEGAEAKVSSIHVNGWFGAYDKLGMSGRMLRECFGIDIRTAAEQIVFVGDSPNDAPMFAAFPHAVGVANVAAFADRIAALPAYVTPSAGGAGFAELVATLLSARGATSAGGR
ncbi:HAD-IIB family hydrolase [Oceanibacterium hippocampi]|uniref:Phosphoglycolate phosphatase n=1 Tax=Oceanibacterium hippocampi TaxID=745714 RepID=A0A1Y5S6L5_9PROT|nr:HAD-IIB family hydrolase [Oceanibacterium hippocampi]SLN32771.1 phosphoglycolate phosphatase [Oceanibacterium hippocampi]